jgi:hypothetical protein
MKFSWMNNTTADSQRLECNAAMSAESPPNPRRTMSPPFRGWKDKWSNNPAWAWKRLLQARFILGLFLILQMDATSSTNLRGP